MEKEKREMVEWNDIVGGEVLTTQEKRGLHGGGLPPKTMKNGGGGVETKHPMGNKAKG